MKIFLGNKENLHMRKKIIVNLVNLEFPRRSSSQKLENKQNKWSKNMKMHICETG